MPYIKKQDRARFDEFVDQLKPATPGELNYSITRIIHKYLKQKGVSYKNLNEVIGVLESAKLELYRKITAPYENKKIDENGRVGVLDEE